MNDKERTELGPLLTAAVEAWYDASPPTGALASALDRIARRPPVASPRWPVWALVPGLAAAFTFAIMLTSAPEAWAAVTSTLRPPPGPGPTEAELRASVRPLLFAHIGALLAGYVAFFAVWAVTQFEVAIRLFGVRRWHKWVARWGPWGVGAGVALWGLGTVLGGLWASTVMGRFWGWGSVEVQSLCVIAVGLTWLALAWRWRGCPSLAAWWALLFWVLLDLLWGGLHWLLVPTRSYGLQPAIIRFFVAGAVLNVLLLGSAWYAGRARKIVEGPTP